LVLQPTEKESLNTPEKIAEMVKLMTELGPDIDLIARISGVFKETVRYWYKEKILGKGMAVQAVPNEAALGMRRVAAKVKVADTFLPHIQPTFLAMNDWSFAAAFEMAIPDEYYVLHATVPEKFVADYRSFILKLKEMGIFESAELYEFDWFRRAPMRAELYDFEESRWDYDWQNPLPIEKAKMMKPKPAAEAKLDKIDLLILKELQLDAARPLTEINRAIEEKNKIEINYKTMEWHYRRHVVERGLISGYSIRWLGTRYDRLAEKVEHRRHRYLVVNVMVKAVTNDEFLELTGKANRTPFLWSEMKGKDYLAQFAFPIEATMDAFEYLREVLRPFADRASHYVVDQKNAAQFALPYNSWSDYEKEWRFEKDSSLARMENLVLKIKNGNGFAT
jgi:DNA-binding Lrp family transcriptional regulator